LDKVHNSGLSSGFDPEYPELKGGLSQKQLVFALSRIMALLGIL